MPFQFYCPQGHLLEGHESQMGQQSQCPICGGVFVIPVAPGMAPAQHGWAPGFAPQSPGYYPPQSPAGPPGAYPGYPHYPGGFPPGAYPGGYAGAAVPGGAQPWPGHEQAAGQPGLPAGGAAVMQPGAAPAATSPAAFPDIQIQTEPAAPAATAAAAPAAAVEGPKPAPPPENQEPRVVRIPCPQGHELQTPMDMVQQDVLCPICNTQFQLRYEDSIEFKEEQAELRRRKAERVNQVALKWSIGSAIAVVLGIIGMVIYLALTAPSESPQSSSDSPVAEEPAAHAEMPDSGQPKAPAAPAADESDGEP